MIDEDLASKVRIIALGLAEGDTLNGQICPHCGGGTHGDRAFSVTRDNHLLKFICYRASCPFQGIIGSTGGFIQGAAEKSRSKLPNPFTASTESLTEAQREFFLNSFPSVSEEFIDNIQYAPGRNRFTSPIRNTLGYRTGTVARGYRALQDFNGPKAITYWDKIEPLKHDFTYAIGGDGSKVCIVEDQLSANAIATQLCIPVVALLGSHISDNLIIYLKKKLGYKDIYIILDEDAWYKADKYEDRFKLLGVHAVQWNNKLDPKNQTPEQLQESFGWLLKDTDM